MNSFQQFLPNDNRKQGHGLKHEKDVISRMIDKLKRLERISLIKQKVIFNKISLDIPK